MELTEALAFARDRKQGVLATIRANGRPQLSNIMFVPDEGDTFLISVTDDRAKTANLRRDPRASFYVLGDNFYQYVVIEAAAELSPVAADPQDATVEALMGYYERPGEHPDWKDTGPPWWRTSGWSSRCTQRAYGILGSNLDAGRSSQTPG